jgi:hypothetical protein
MKAKMKKPIEKVFFILQKILNSVRINYVVSLKSLDEFERARRCGAWLSVLFVVKVLISVTM